MQTPDHIVPNRIPVPGWKGGFSTSDPAFAYPEPNLSSLPLLGNMDNVPRLQREVRVFWPEFSWETVPGDPTSRCYKMFAPDISRAGYDDRGRVWSIVCPQQGSFSPILGSLNIEVTVTGQRGWFDESVADRERDVLAADMNVTGKVWFAPSAKDGLVYNLLKTLVESKRLAFPLDKAHAIQIALHDVGRVDVPTIAVRSGPSADFDCPAFAKHYDDGAWGVANVAVQIGRILTYGDPMVDDFNAMVVDILNAASGNILLEGNVLTWNVWFDAPTAVDRSAWLDHATRWRESIDTGHGSPDGPPSPTRYLDGSLFAPAEALLEMEWERIRAWVRTHFEISLPPSPAPHWMGARSVSN